MISGVWEFWSECGFKPLLEDGMESDVERKNSKMLMVWSLEQRADRILCKQKHRPLKAKSSLESRNISSVNLPQHL